MNPEHNDLWFLPLGGCGEIGMNMNLYGHAGRWLMVDCGVTFSRSDETGPDVQMADPEFIEKRRDRLVGLVVTHAHQDHVGAVAHLWPRLQCPVYCTPFTAEILGQQLRRAGLSDLVPVHVVRPGGRLELEVFNVDWLNLTHSTPESQALLIHTEAGSVFHTGDWKLDTDPVVGPAFSPSRFQKMSDLKVKAMICDSTNATVRGRSTSEGALYRGLLEQAQGEEGRIIVGCFGSNIARLATLARIAQETGRRAALLGRSLHRYHAAARAAGVWDEDLKFIDPHHLGYLPPHEVMAIATGSQGEPRSALTRLANETHPNMLIEVGDKLLLSSRVIPGNEEALKTLITRMRALGVTVVQDGLGPPIHASGHPAQSELKDMYGWVKPAVAIPVHGEPRHLDANAAMAKSVGVPQQFVGRNGDLFMLAPVRGVRRGAAPIGRLGLENDQLIPWVPPEQGLTWGHGKTGSG
ncbi:MAG: ribonuclease J [Lysobacterales bacterium]